MRPPNSEDQIFALNPCTLHRQLAYRSQYVHNDTFSTCAFRAWGARAPGASLGRTAWRRYALSGRLGEYYTGRGWTLSNSCLGTLQPKPTCSSPSFGKLRGSTREKRRFDYRSDLYARGDRAAPSLNGVPEPVDQTHPPLLDPSGSHLRKLDCLTAGLRRWHRSDGHRSRPIGRRRADLPRRRNPPSTSQLALPQS